jgi:glycosyltransferase involved in cell wall biosynthesis
VADYAAEQVPFLAEAFDVIEVGRDPGPVLPEADLSLYHLGNSPDHAFVYRAACLRPGVALLHDWSLHHLVLSETVEKGDVTTYLSEMRRAYGERGSFVGRQVSRGLGGALLPALFPLNERVLDRSLGVVGLTGYVASRAERRLGARPVLHLPHHLSLPLDPLPTREEARDRLGLPRDALLVTAPGLATTAKRLETAVRAAAALRRDHPSMRLVVAGGVDPSLPLEDRARVAGLGEALVVTGRLELAAFVRHLVAADVVLALRFPSHGEMSGAVVRALGVGRPVLVTSGTPPWEEFPEGVVVPVDPGPREAGQLTTLLGRLLEDAPLRERIGRLAAGHVRERHEIRAVTASLVAFLRDVARRREELAAALPPPPPPEGSLLARLDDELRFAAMELGLGGVPAGLERLLEELAPREP